MLLGLPAWIPCNPADSTPPALSAKLLLRTSREQPAPACTSATDGEPAAHSRTRNCLWWLWWRRTRVRGASTPARPASASPHPLLSADAVRKATGRCFAGGLVFTPKPSPWLKQGLPACSLPCVYIHARKASNSSPHGRTKAHLCAGCHSSLRPPGARPHHSHSCRPQPACTNIDHGRCLTR